MMKRILMILSVLVAFLPVLNARSVINPQVKLNSTKKGDVKVTICGVDILKDATTIRMKVKFKPEHWIYVSKNTVLRTDNDDPYLLKETIGIKAGEQVWMPQTGILEFVMVFPPIGENTKSIDIIEPDGWLFIGIDLTDGKNREQHFSQFGNSDGFEYAYYSPIMLKTMATNTVQNIPVEKLTRMELVTTHFNGEDKKLANAVRDVIVSNDMELVFKEDKGDMSSLEFYVQLDSSRNKIKRLLIVQHGSWGGSAKILFAESNFRIDELKSLIDTQKEAKKKP